MCASNLKKICIPVSSCVKLLLLAQYLTVSMILWNIITRLLSAIRLSLSIISTERTLLLWSWYHITIHVPGWLKLHPDERDDIKRDKGEMIDYTIRFCKVYCYKRIYDTSICLFLFRIMIFHSASKCFYTSIRYTIIADIYIAPTPLDQSQTCLHTWYMMITYLSELRNLSLMVALLMWHRDIP